ncbi:glutamate ABC transporter substrate-binding protein [Embleya scabrispora]|uniref:glutamate ABC transporter substrate-binding protein n=1 Tax=Embleya scabrispora TaxID=159449 RepID=UPI0003606C75|nr:glutamate ABC transporter substrate-binding protein [Embleya scabrispora]MYS85566.1 transporter substrate-binding domain-containing protein [Streptomyces sp. SID5474]
MSGFPLRRPRAAASPRRLRTAVPAVLAALSLTALAACSGGSSSDVPGGAKPAGEDVAKKADVAPDSTILPNSTMAKIKARGYLIVGGSQDAPLWSQLNPISGKTDGFDAEMGRLLAKYIIGKPEVKIVSSATETREALLQNGTVDVVFQTYTITPKRAEQVAFAGPYYSSGQAILVKKGAGGIKVPADLNGKTVIAGANTPAIAAIKQVAPDAKVVTFGSDPECVTALRQGRGDAYVQDQALLVADVKQNPDTTVVGEPFTADPYGIGLGHDDVAFKTFVNDWLRKIGQDGSWQAIWKQTLGTVVEGNPPTPPAIGGVPGS